MSETKEKELIVKDTYELQMRSLRNFMESLGYHIVYAYPKGLFFEADSNKHQPIVSVSSAIKMHNNQIKSLRMSTTRYVGDDKWYWEKLCHCFPITTTPYMLKRAFDAKIVDKVKLQFSKKKGCVVKQSDIIKWNSVAAELSFGKEIYSVK